MRFDGKTAAVTGAASGIGRATAEAFAKAGARVLLADINDEAGEAVAGALQAQGCDAEYFHVDITDAKSIEAWRADVATRPAGGWAQLRDVAVHTTGIAVPHWNGAQVIGPAGPLAGGFTNAGGDATVEVAVPAALASFLRAEVRRLDSEPVLNPLEGVPGLAMVAMTNPVFLG